MPKSKTSPVRGPIEEFILTIRGNRVILDADLAGLYGVQTKVLNQAVKRNKDRFPDDFMFRLQTLEWSHLKSQVVTTSSHGGRRSLPFVFTEHGALMAANILNSPGAHQMSVYVVRAFIKQREMLMARTEVMQRLAQLDSKLLQHDEALRVIWHELQPLLSPPPQPPKRKIGFDAP